VVDIQTVGESRPVWLLGPPYIHTYAYTIQLLPMMAYLSGYWAGIWKSSSCSPFRNILF